MKVLRRGQPVAGYIRPHQWANDWITGDDGVVYNPASVQLDPVDVARFDASRNSPSVGTFWSERRLDRVTLRFRRIPPDHDSAVEAVAELLDEAASAVLDKTRSPDWQPGQEPDYDHPEYQNRLMVAMWFNRLAWHLRTGHVVPALVHEVLMASEIGPSAPWWHGPDGIVSKATLIVNNREGIKE